VKGAHEVQDIHRVKVQIVLDMVVIADIRRLDVRGDAGKLLKKDSAEIGHAHSSSGD
jgi:hypothetical protein